MRTGLLHHLAGTLVRIAQPATQGAAEHEGPGAVVGGLLLGALLLAVPQMYGVGYPVLQAGITGGYALGFLLLLAVAKMVATSLTIGIGGSGGVFAPSLFCGAAAGAGVGGRPAGRRQGRGVRRPAPPPPR